jgi:hypothetical protein
MATQPRKWTDDDVVAYLVSTGIPVARYCIIGGELYGHFYDESQRSLFKAEFAVCMDDLDDRAVRVIRYLRKIGAPEVNP